MNESTIGNPEEPLADFSQDEDGNWIVRIWRPVSPGKREFVENITLHPDDQDVLKWVAKNFKLYDPSYESLEERVS